MRNTSDPNQPAYVNQSGYEKRDIALPTISIWVIFLLIFIIISAVVSYGAYLFLSPKNLSDPAAVARSSNEVEEPPSPQLQAYPKTEMRDFRLLEESSVNEYGKYREAEGRYRIPVERAIELTAERGFPKTESKSKASAASTEMSGAGESGVPSRIPNAGRGTIPPDSRNIDNENAPIR